MGVGKGGKEKPYLSWIFIHDFDKVEAWASAGRGPWSPLDFHA